MDPITLNDVRNGGDFEFLILKRRHSQELFEQYVSWSAAYEAAKKAQGDDWNPAAPPTPIAQELMAMIKAEIREIKGEADPDPQVYMYRLVGTPFDQFHRADACVEYNKCRVLIDLTIRDFKPNVRPFTCILRLRDLQSGNLRTIAENIAVTLLTQERQNILVEFAWDSANSEEKGNYQL